MILLVADLAKCGLLPDALRLVRANRRTSLGFIEQPGRKEGLIADHPRGEPMP